MDSKSLYDLLGVNESASPEDIRKAYYRAALRLHPDKQTTPNASVAEFQQLSRAYSILSDSEKRSEYDAGTLDEMTCDIDPSLLSSDEQIGLCRELFKRAKQLETESIQEELSKASKNIDAEDERIIREKYVEFRGDLRKIMQFANAKKALVVSLLRALVDSGELDTYDAFEATLQKLDVAKMKQKENSRKRQKQKRDAEKPRKTIRKK